MHMGVDAGKALLLVNVVIWNMQQALYIVTDTLCAMSV
jgi:hypothetical protein